MVDNDKGLILCIGNALLDISYHGDVTFLRKHGLQANDAVVLPEDRFEALRMDLEKSYTMDGQTAGGACQNSARVSQWLLGPGNSVTFLGSIGSDRNGSILREMLDTAGVRAIYEIIPDSPTGCCLAVITGGVDRSLAALLGAATKFSINHLIENWSAIEKAKFIYSEGFFLPVCLEACLRIGQHCCQHPEKRFLFNLSAEYVTIHYKNELLQVLPYVDILFGYEVDALIFAKELGSDCGTDVVKAAKFLSNFDKSRKSPERIVVVTSGPKPVIAAVGGSDVPIISEVEPIETGKIKDTTGAGDSFVGGFMAKLAKGGSLDECLRWGSQTAAIVIQNIGCSFPTEKPLFVK